MDDDKVNGLVVFLSNPNRKADEHVETVMEMVRRLAKYEHDLRKKDDELGALKRSMVNDGVDYDPYPSPRHNPGMLQIPENARSVEVKF